MEASVAPMAPWKGAWSSTQGPWECPKGTTGIICMIPITDIAVANEPGGARAKLGTSPPLPQVTNHEPFSPSQLLFLEEMTRGVREKPGLHPFSV